MFKYNNLIIITDDINEGTEKIYRKVIKDFYKDSANITLEIIKKQNMHQDKGILFQYVDINLYATYRFLFPNMHKDKFNILVDFELFAYQDFKKIYSQTMTQNDKDNIEKLSIVFEAIKDIYQNIKLHSLQHIYVKDELYGNKVHPISSMIYKDIEQNNNFAQNFFNGVNKFCTIRTNQTFSSSERPVDFKTIARDPA